MNFQSGQNGDLKIHDQAIAFVERVWVEQNLWSKNQTWLPVSCEHMLLIATLQVPFKFAITSYQVVMGNTCISLMTQVST